MVAQSRERVLLALASLIRLVKPNVSHADEDARHDLLSTAA